MINPINKKIKLTDEEMAELKLMAQYRCDKKNLTKTWSRGSSGQEKNLHGHLLGVISEYVVAKEFNGEFDKRVYGKGGDKHRPDVFAEGKRYEIKSTHYWPPILKITGKEETRSVDEIVLCYVSIENSEATIMGSIETESFWENCYKRDFGYGTRYCYEFKEKENIRDDLNDLLVY